jgi:hypothetical protein
MKHLKVKIAKFETGEFKNRFFPCNFGILEAAASTKERDSRQIEPSLSVCA